MVDKQKVKSWCSYNEIKLNKNDIQNEKKYINAGRDDIQKQSTKQCPEDIMWRRDETESITFKRTLLRLKVSDVSL